MSRVPMESSTHGADPFGPAIAARYPEGLVPKGVSAELMAAKWKLDRELLDEYSAQSHRRAAAAAASGACGREIIPITLAGGDEHTIDETVRPATTAEALAELKPSFLHPTVAQRFPQIDWKITPGSSSRSPTAHRPH